MPRRPPHFKVFTSAKNHEKLRRVYWDNAALALWVRLGVEGIERFADRTGDVYLVHDRELPALTGVGRPDVARTSLERLADMSPISAERDGDVWRITFPNFAEKHGFQGGNGTRKPTSPSYADADADAGKKKPRASHAGRRPETDPQALQFASDFRSALDRVHPGFKAPTDAAFERWRRDARLLLAERPEPDVRALAKWLFDTTSPSEGASFWRSVVLSVPKFRQKYDQMAARRRQEENRGRTKAAAGTSTSPLADRARAALREVRGGRTDPAG